MGFGRPNVHEVNAQPFDLGAKLCEAVEQRLSLAPIVTVRPVRADLLHVGQGNALAPVLYGFRVGPPRGGQAAVEIL